MANSAMESKKSEANKKAAVAAVTATASAVVIAAGAPVAGAIGLAGSAYLGYRWIRYRIKEGIRF